jgi:hypothetical protein
MEHHPVIWTDLAVRVVAGLSGLATLYVAWFVYEDEEKLLQSKVETWWLQFDDLRNNMVSRQAAFVVVVAQKAHDALDTVFGPSLMAKDAIASATCLALAGYLAAILLDGLQHFSIVTNGAIATASVAAFACGIAPLASDRFRKFPRVLLWVVVVVCILDFIGQFFALAISLVTEEMPPGYPSLLSVAVGPFASSGAFAAGVALILLQVAAARRALNLTVVSKSEWPVVRSMFLIGVAIAIVLAATWMSSDAFSPDSFTLQNLLFLAGTLILGTSIIAAVLYILFAGTAVIMLLHRMAWPLVSRLLYSLQRYKIVQSKKTLNAIGAVLLGVAIPGAKGWLKLLGDLLSQA